MHKICSLNFYTQLSRTISYHANIIYKPLEGLIQDLEKALTEISKQPTATFEEIDPFQHNST